MLFSVVFCEKGTFRFLFLSLTNVFLFFPGVISYTEYLFLLCILTSKCIYFDQLRQNNPENYLGGRDDCPVCLFVWFQSPMQASGLLSTCLMQMEMKWWTRGSSWWYEPHLDVIKCIWSIHFYIIIYHPLTSWRKFSVRRRTKKKLLKRYKDLTSRYDFSFEWLIEAAISCILKDNKKVP